MKIEILARVKYPGVDTARQVSVTINGDLDDAKEHAETYFRGHVADQLEVDVIDVTVVDE